MDDNEKIGSSQTFVLAHGLQLLDGHWALIGNDGKNRYFAELTADSDRPDVFPADAYRTLLSSLQPGWTIRLIQIFWPDPLPRQAFNEQFVTWDAGKQFDLKSEGQKLLYQSMAVFLQETPLPFVRRTILEFVLVAGSEAASWWEGIATTMHSYGIQMTPLSADEIQALARWIFNPSLDF